MIDSVPFSNGTEAGAWMSRWCSFCAHDHGMHDGAEANPDNTCRLIGEAMLGASYNGDRWRWPEAWLPEPPGRHGLPSYMCCRSFQPCTSGDCTGDPAPEERAQRVELVRREWAAYRAGHASKETP